MNKKLLTACCILSVVAVALFSFVPVKAQTTVIGLNPSNYVAHSVGENFTINIVVTDVQNLWSWCVGISWDPNTLSLIGNPREGPFLRAKGQTLFLPLPAINGTIKELSSTLLSLASASGSGVLATLDFNITKETVESPITLFNTTLLAPLPSTGGTNPSIDHQVENATVTLVLGKAPVANAGQDQTVNQGIQVVLNGSKTSSSDPNGNYTWSFKDGTQRTLQGMIINYTFNTPGIYTVMLTVQDSYGNSTDRTTITVRDTTPPVPKISVQGYSSGQAIPAQQLITFDGSESTDLYSTIQYYAWEMGDGSPTINGDPIVHAYSNPGTYTVTLIVVDAAGNNATATMTIGVTLADTTTSAASLNLPTYLLGILLVITALAIGGSVFWLRKPRIANEGNEAGASSENSAEEQ
jgi:PKD repeat protein